MKPKYNHGWYRQLLNSFLELALSVLAIAGITIACFIVIAVLTILVTLLFDIFTGYNLITDLIRPFFRRLLGLP